MGLEKCVVCHEYTWGLSHKCKPGFYVFRNDEELYDAMNQEWTISIYRASEPDEAAIKYCEHDYETPSYLDVLVIDQKSYQEQLDKITEDNVDLIVEETLAMCKKFSMESEIVRNYWATEVK